MANGRIERQTKLADPLFELGQFSDGERSSCCCSLKGRSNQITTTNHLAEEYAPET